MKATIIICLAFIQCFLIYFSLTYAFKVYKLINYQQFIHSRHNYVIIIITIVIGLIIINRQVSYKFNYNDGHTNLILIYQKKNSLN